MHLRNLRPIHLALVLLVCWPASVRADEASAADEPVVLEQSFESAGFGPRHYGRLKGTSRLVIAADQTAARQESSSQFTGKMLKRFSGTANQFDVIRLDRNLVWTATGKQYAEVSFASMRQQREEALAHWKEMGRSRDENANEDAEVEDAVARSEYSWGPPEVLIEEKEQTLEIAELTATLTEVRVRSVGTHNETGQTCEVVWELDQYLAPENETAEKIAAFYRIYAERLGFSPQSMTQLGDQVESMLAGYGDGLQQLFDQLAQKDRMSLRYTLGLKVGGACNSAGGASGRGQATSAKPFSGVKKRFAGLKGRFGRGSKKKKEEEQSGDDEQAEVDQTPASSESGATPGEIVWTSLFEFTVNTEKIGKLETPEVGQFDEPIQLKKVDKLAPRLGS